MRYHFRPLTVNVTQAVFMKERICARLGSCSSYSHPTIRSISSATGHSNPLVRLEVRSNSVNYGIPETKNWITSRLRHGRDFVTSTGAKEVQEHSNRVSVNFKDGKKDTNASYSHFWLRDNCRCSKCVNQDTMQRAFDTFSIPEDVRPLQVKTESDGLHVTWSYENHESFYPWKWLQRHAPTSGPLQHKNQAQSLKSLWERDGNGNVIAPKVRYEDVMASDKGVGEWTAKIHKYGFCFVDGCPVSPENTQELLERIAFIRETHYGGFYDFTSDLTMKDTAYTSLALPAHTDTTYFSDPAGLQMFHMLSHTDGSGGHSLLVDGFEALNTLRREDPDSFKILCQVPIPSHASGNEGITITPYKHFPMFNYQSEALMDSDFPDMVRWNNDDRGVVPLSSVDGTVTAEDWYSAARKWNEIITRKEIEYWVRLEPGTALIFDNWRVMHGRSAFTGKRRMCGGYINRDDYVSRWRNTNFSNEEVMDQIL